MKKLGKILLWIIGIFAWFMFFITMWAADTNKGTYTHPIILIITGICLIIYIWKKTGSGAKELEEENRELKEEVQKLRQQLQDQAVRRAMEKAESRERES